MKNNLVKKYFKCLNCQIFDSIETNPSITNFKCHYCHSFLKEISVSEFKKLNQILKGQEKRNIKKLEIRGNQNIKRYKRVNSQFHYSKMNINADDEIYNNNNINNKFNDIYFNNNNYNNNDNYNDKYNIYNNYNDNYNNYNNNYNKKIIKNNFIINDNNNINSNKYNILINNNKNIINNYKNNNINKKRRKKSHNNINLNKNNINRQIRVNINLNKNNNEIRRRDSSSSESNNQNENIENDFHNVIRPSNMENVNNINRNRNIYRNINRIIDRNPFRIIVQRQNVPNYIFDPSFSIFGSIFNGDFQDNYSSNFRSNYRGNFENEITNIREQNLAESRIQADPPASKENLNKLKKFDMNEKYCKKENGKLELPNCCICLNTINFGEKTILLPCGHMFHCDCILTWLKNSNTCPMCRFEIK